MLSKMCIIFTVATAGLLVGSRSAAADCIRCCEKSFTLDPVSGLHVFPNGDIDIYNNCAGRASKDYRLQWWCDTCTAAYMYFTDAEAASVTTTATGAQAGAKCYDHKYESRHDSGTICACEAWGASGTCILTGSIWGGSCPYGCTGDCAKQKKCKPAGSIGTCCTAPPACTAGANGAPCQNGGTVSGTSVLRQHQNEFQLIRFYHSGNNCGCNCATGYEGANCQTAKACTAGANGAPCQNGGTVSGTTDNCGCNCATGYEGANCQTAKACTAEANSASCQNGGTAFGTGNNCGCNCAAGYSGANCQTAPSNACVATCYSYTCQYYDDQSGSDLINGVCDYNGKNLGKGKNLGGEHGCDCSGCTCDGTPEPTTPAPAPGTCTGHVGWGSIRHYSAHESPCNRDVFVGKLKEGEGYYWSTYPNGAGWCRSISREGVTELKKQLESRINWVHLFGAESEYGRTYFPPTPTTKCVAPKTAYLKAGDEEEAQLPFANVVDADADPTAATTTTNTQPTPAEVARTVFAGIIAACGLYVVWVVARKTPPSNSNKDVLDAPENMAEISEI